MVDIAAGLPVFIAGGSAGTSLEAAERIRTWWEKASHVYPENTKKAWASDWKVFLGFCALKDVVSLPATSQLVASFVDHCRLQGKKPATTRRYLSTIARAHMVGGFPDPCTR